MYDIDLSTYFLDNRVIFLCDEIDSDTSSRIVSLLLYLDLECKSEIKLYINSPGGDVSGFFAIYDTINYIRSPVRTICIGEALSAAADLLASGSPGRREASPNAQIMIHSIQLDDISGTVQDLTSYVKRTKDLNDKIIRILSSNTKQTIDKIEKDCKFDKFMSAQEALEYGIIDRILKSKEK